MPGLFSKIAEAATVAGGAVARTANNAREVLTDKDLRRCETWLLSPRAGRASQRREKVLPMGTARRWGLV